MKYDFDGDRYEKASAHQKEWGGELIDLLDLGGDERVLDLGCGDGALSARIAAALPRGRVVGLDASPGMISAARKHAAPNLEFRLGDALDLCEREAYDVVFSNAALHWVKDHRRLLGRVRDALKEGGRIAWEFAAEGNCDTFFGAVRNAMADKRFAPHFEDFDWPWLMPSIADYDALLASCGFSRRQVDELVRDRYFPSSDAMIRWIDQPCLVPFLPRLPEGDREPFRQAVITETLSRAQVTDGRCFERFRRVRVLARK